MKLTSELHELAQTDLGAVHRIAENAIGESGRLKFFEMRGRQACAKKAQSVPLPGASADAFIRGATRVGDVIVREVVPIHIACLQAVDSPILKMVAKATEAKDKSANADFDEESQWAICYIFTTEPKQLRKVLKDGGVTAIKEAAESCVDGNWNLAKINSVCLAVLEQFHRHIQSTVKYSAEVEAQVESSFFQALMVQPQKPADSVGS